MSRIQILLPRLVVLAAICVAPALLSAQIDRSALEGTVTDSSGAFVPKVTIEAVATATGYRNLAQSGNDGSYRVAGLAVGKYSVRFVAKGFKPLQVSDVELEVGKTRTLNARLELGPVTTDVSVHASAVALDQSSAEIATVIDNNQVQELPINGRNWASLLALVPGALDDGGGDQRTIRFSGHARDDNNYKIDGVDATGIQEQAQKSTTRLQISEDAIEEYHASSSLYDAEYGAGAGGQVDIVTKTGGNKFHGSGFEYLRNSVFDSRSFVDLDSDPAQTGPSKVPPFRLNQYGATLGGPIIKDKTFFFFSYEGLRQFRGTTLHAFVPSAAFKSQLVAQSPVLAPIMNVFPAGQLSTCVTGAQNPTNCPDVDEYTHLGSTTIHEDSWLARVDHQFSERTRLYGRVTRDVSNTFSPLGNLLDQQAIHINPSNIAVTLEHSFSTNILNEAKFGINRSPFHNPQVSVFPLAVDFGGIFEGLNNSNTDNEVGTSISGLDNLTVISGRNTFKMGGEVRRVRLNQGITADSGFAFLAGADTMSTLQNIQSNLLDSFSIRESWCCLGLRHTFILPYFQDEMKVTPHLTVNAGLRWEYYAPITEAHSRSRIFDAQRCASTNYICSQGSPFYFPNYRNFDPRVSVAWSPARLHDKTVIRAGFGIYSGAGQNDDLNAGLESDTTRLSLSSTDNFSACGSQLSYPIDPFIPCAAAAGRTPRALQRDRRDLYTQEWGLSVQHELPGAFLLQTGYLGHQGARLFARTYINVCEGNTNQTSTGCVRPISQYGMIDLKRNDGTSSFHALQVSLQRSFAKGFSWDTQYMWSHAINDGSIGGGESNAPENVACRSCDKGPSVFDVRHNIITNAVYELPFGSGKRWLSANGAVSKVLGGWTLSGIHVWHTGHPLTVLAGRSSNVIPDGNDRSDQRPDLVPGVSLIPAGGQTPDNWINSAAFAVPADFTFGNAGRGLVRSPHVWQTDLALQKSVALREGLAMQVRAEAYNIFNHDQYADPNLDILGSGFGQIVSTVNFNRNNDNFAPPNTGSGTPRQLQFGLKFVF